MVIEFFNQPNLTNGSPFNQKFLSFVCNSLFIFFYNYKLTRIILYLGKGLALILAVFFSEYSVRWWADKEIKDTKCLGTQPTWMKERKDILGPLKMKQIFLPGTHDSASYNENDDGASIVSDFAVTQV